MSGWQARVVVLALLAGCFSRVPDQRYNAGVAVAEQGYNDAFVSIEDAYMARVRSIDELRRQKIVVRPNSQCMPVHPVLDANAYVDLVSGCERLSRELIELDSLAPGNKPDCEPHY